MTIYNNAFEVWSAINSVTSVDDIDTILKDANSSNITIDSNDLKNLVLSQSVSANNANTVILYSGKINGENASDIAKAVANSSNGTVAIIDNTVAAKLIATDGFENAILKSFNGVENDFNTFLFGETTSSGTRISHGLWGDISEKFVTENSFTEVKTISPNSGADSILFQKEVSAILDKSDTTVKTIDGLKVSDLKSKLYSDGLVGKFNNDILILLTQNV